MANEQTAAVAALITEVTEGTIHKGREPLPASTGPTEKQEQMDTTEPQETEHPYEEIDEEVETL